MERTIFTAALLATAGLFILLLREEVKFRRLLQLERDRNAMLAILSHRLRTPLTAMKWYTEMLINGDYGESRIAQVEALNHIDAGAQNAIGLLDKFLGFSRAKMIEAPAKPKAINLYEVIKDVLSSLEDRIRDRRISILFQKEQNAAVVYADLMLCHSVIDTVISNATIYSDESGSVHISCVEAQDSIVLRVEDDGIGIRKEEAPNMFKQFFRGAAAKEHYATGTGLGLALIQNFLKKIGGSITFESPPKERRIDNPKGPGTVFFVQFPKR